MFHINIFFLFTILENLQQNKKWIESSNPNYLKANLNKILYGEPKTTTSNVHFTKKISQYSTN